MASEYFKMGVLGGDGRKAGYLAVGGTLLAGAGLAGLIAVNTVYKKCPPNKLLVICGRGLARGDGMSIVKSGGATVVPLLQDYR